MLGPCAFRWVGSKNGVASTKWCLVRICSKVVSAVRFWEKNLFFLESVSFHYEMFDVTNLRLVLGVCTVQVVIFIKKYLVKLFRIKFWELIKILIMIILKILEKLCHVNFFKFDLKKEMIKKRKISRWAFKKTLSVMFLDFW